MYYNDSNEAGCAVYLGMDGISGQGYTEAFAVTVIREEFI